MLRSGKRIWIVNYYTSSPELVSNPRYLELARHFQEAGYEVITFNSSVKHGTDIDLIPDGRRFYAKQYGEFNFVHVKSPHYSGNGLRRMWSIFVFAWRLNFHRRRFEAPDIVLHNIHPPFDYPIVRMAKKLNAKYVCEAWDLWPEDFVTFGLVGRNNPALKVAYAIEKKFYEAADQMVFTFDGAKDYLRRQGWTCDQGGTIDMKRYHYINNGINIRKFDSDILNFPRVVDGFEDKDICKIVYLGSIRLANHVKDLIDAALILKNDHRYRFYIYGDGDERTNLEHYVKNNEINNVSFMEKRIRLEECAWVVSHADINVMNYEKGFGKLGVSSGKMFQYLAAGKPIVCNVSIAYDDVITDNNLGVARNLSSPIEYAAEIKRIADLPKEEYKAMCQRVRRVGEMFDYKLLAAKELSVIEG